MVTSTKSVVKQGFPLWEKNVNQRPQNHANACAGKPVPRGSLRRAQVDRRSTFASDKDVVELLKAAVAPQGLVRSRTQTGGLRAERRTTSTFALLPWQYSAVERRCSQRDDFCVLPVPPSLRIVFGINVDSLPVWTGFAHPCKCTQNDHPSMPLSQKEKWSKIPEIGRFGPKRKISVPELQKT
jgi:hypothetical protein